MYSLRSFSNYSCHSDPERSEGEESRPFASAQGDMINNLIYSLSIDERGLKSDPRLLHPSLAKMGWVEGRVSYRSGEGREGKKSYRDKG